MRLAIDLDGVLADFNKAFGKLLIQVTGEDKLPEDWEQRLNDTFPSTWNWHLDAGYTAKQSELTWDAIFRDKTFWQDLDPIEGAQDALRQLNRLQKSGHEVYFVTSRAGKMVKRQSENWLETYGMERPTVVISFNKLPFLISTRADLFVDDKLATINEVVRYYEENRVPGPQVFLKSAPWNHEPRVKGVVATPSVVEALKSVNLYQEIKRGRPKEA